MNDRLQTASERTSGTASLVIPTRRAVIDDGEDAPCTESRVEVTSPVPTAMKHPCANSTLSTSRAPIAIP